MHYIPILKGKDAEYRALAGLHHEARVGLTPLIDLLPLDTGSDPDEWVDSTASRLAAAWPISRPIFADAPHLGGVRVSTGEPALIHLVRVCNERNINLVPVTGLDRADDYQDAIRETIEERNAFRACLRVTNFDTDFPSPNISDLLERLALQAESTDLLLDFGAVPAGGSGALGGLMHSYLESIPGINRWRTVTVAATAFPERVGALDKNAISRVPRSEWRAWLSLQNRSMRRHPQFGDYGVQHPQLVKFDGKKMQVSIHLRYTADQNWLVREGLRKGLWSHARALCAAHTTAGVRKPRPLLG